MILELDNWYLGYQQILTDCRHNEDGVAGSVLLLCAADVDAMAGARIWTYMLRSDGISYQMLPCASYSQLEQSLADKKADDVRALVLMNLGANRNLTRLFDKEELGLDSSVKIYILDCRRPVHLANVHAGNNVVVFWDSVQNDDVPSDGDNLSGDESSSDEEDDESDNDSSDDDGEHEFNDVADDEGEHEAEFEGDNEANPQDEMNSASGDGDESIDDGVSFRDDDSNSEGPSKRRKTEKEAENLDDESSGSDEASEAEPTAGIVSSNPEGSQPPMTPREIHQDRRNRLRAYYASGSFYGSPASYIAFRVSTQLRFAEIGDLLWFAW